jgi:hypothetical protein
MKRSAANPEPSRPTTWLRLSSPAPTRTGMGWHRSPSGIRRDPHGSGSLSISTKTETDSSSGPSTKPFRISKRRTLPGEKRWNLSNSRGEQDRHLHLKPRTRQIQERRLQQIRLGYLVVRKIMIDVLMNFRKRAALIASAFIFLSACSPSLEGTSPPRLQPGEGDRIVFLGNAFFEQAIRHGELEKSPTYPAAILKCTGLGGHHYTSILQMKSTRTCDQIRKFHSTWSHHLQESRLNKSFISANIIFWYPVDH